MANNQEAVIRELWILLYDIDVYDGYSGTSFMCMGGIAVEGTLDFWHPKDFSPPLHLDSRMTPQ